MTVKQLIEQLEDMDEDAEVRFVYQSSYPLQDDIRGVWQMEGPECSRQDRRLDGGRCRRILDLLARLKRVLTPLLKLAISLPAFANSRANDSRERQESRTDTGRSPCAVD